MCGLHGVSKTPLCASKLAQMQSRPGLIESVANHHVCWFLHACQQAGKAVLYGMSPSIYQAPPSLAVSSSVTQALQQQRTETVVTNHPRLLSVEDGLDTSKHSTAVVTAWLLKVFFVSFLSTSYFVLFHLFSSFFIFIIAV